MKGEMDTCRDLGYHGYPKTLVGLKCYETVLMQWTTRKRLRNHFGVPWGFYRDDHRKNRRILKRVRQRIKEHKYSQP